MIKKIVLFLLMISAFSTFSASILSALEVPLVRAESQDLPPWHPWNVTGVQKVVVMFVEFSDVVHIANSSTLQERLTTMATYFQNVSFGKISVDTTVFGDHWEKLNQTMGYYGQDAGKSHDSKGWEFIVDSVEAWNRFVNFSNYDSLIIIHAGEDQSSYPSNTTLLWRQNFCSFGRASRRVIAVAGQEYSFWGLAYDSEFEEWGLIAHEFGHSLGLPDLYIENETLAFDEFSLMARGDRNGVPQGTLPALLDGFSMYLLGWLTPRIITLNSTEDVVEMTPLGRNLATLLKIPLSNSEFYLVEVRENSGYDKDTVFSPSVIVYTIDETKESGNGIASLLTNGVMTQGETYSDTARSASLRFVRYDSSGHSAVVGLSAKLYFADVDFPDLTECFYPVTVEVRVFDSSGTPAQGIRLNISIGKSGHLFLVTDQEGKAAFQFRFGLDELGTNRVGVSSVNMLIGETEREILVVFPWALLIVPLILVASIVLMIRIFRSRKSPTQIWKPKLKAMILR